jgi:hypothetical protein
MHKGVLDQNGDPVNTPHGLFVDDDLIAEVYDKQRILRAIAAFIETIFILLGESDLSKRQDPISWEKMLEMLINYVNVALGLQINTRQMNYWANTTIFDGTQQFTFPLAWTA